MRTDNHVPTSVTLPAESRVNQVYETTNLADAYSIPLPHGTSTDPEVLARFIFSQPLRWVSVLMAIRDAIAGRLGLKTSSQLKAEDLARAGRVGIFRIYSTHPQEIILGEDDKHLDFRVSVFHQKRASEMSPPHLIVSTVVHCHNLLGRTYIFIIAPFHRVIIQAMLRKASRVGWPKASAT